MATFRGAIELADREGHIAARLRGLNNCLASLSEFAPVNELVPLFSDAIDVARRYGLEGWLAQHLINRIDLNLILGDWDQVARDLVEVSDLALGEFHLAMVSAHRGMLSSLRGDLDQARESAAESERLIAEIDTAPQVTAVAGTNSRTRLLLGELAESLGTGRPHPRRRKRSLSAGCAPASGGVRTRRPGGCGLRSCGDRRCANHHGHDRATAAAPGRGCFVVWPLGRGRRGVSARPSLATRPRERPLM